MAPAHLRGLADPGRVGRPDQPDPARPDGRGEHVPEPGPHGQAGDDPRSHQRGPGDPRDRGRLVRARARRVRDRLRGRLRRAARPARRGGRADPPAARRRGSRPRRPGLRPPRRGRPAPARPAPPADPDRRLGPEEDAPDRRPLADAWNTAGTLEEVAARDAPSCASTARRSGGIPASIERTVSFPIVIRDGAADAAAAFDALLAHNGVEGGPCRHGIPARRPPVAAALLPYRRLGFETVSSGSRRRTTPRRWPGSGRSGPRSTTSTASRPGDGRRPRRRRRWREAGPRRRGPGRPRAGGRRQHRRRPRAPRPARLARPRHGPLHAGRARRPRAGLGDPGRDVRRRGAAGAVRPGDLVPAGRSRPRHAHRPDRPAPRR